MCRERLLENALAYGLKKGADICEIYFAAGKTKRLVGKKRELSEQRLSESQGYSVRLKKKGVLGFSYGVDLTPAALEYAVDSALLSCDFLPCDEDYSFVAPGKEYPQIVEKQWVGLSFDEKRRMLLDMEEAALAQKKVNRIERCSVAEGKGEIILKNTLGLDLSFATAHCSCGLVAVAEAKGETDTGGEAMTAKSFADLEPVKVGETAAKNAQNKLGAVTVPSGEYPVVFHPEAFLDLLAVILPSFLGDTVRKGQSRLADALGEAMAPSDFFLYDDGILKEGVGSCPFDDQGMPTQKTPLVENGVLKNFLYDIPAAAKAHTLPTGSGYTSSVKSLPTTGFGSYYLLGGHNSEKEILQGITKGLYVKNLMGLHMANGISGDFSLGIGGFLIDHGELTQGVRGNMMAGNLFDMIRDIEAIGNDFSFYGYRGAPTVKVKSLKISGKRN